MDEELLELQRQFEFAQQAKSSIRLSDRNVVELVQKLQELHIIDFELLHTVTGKEYITPVPLYLSLSQTHAHTKLSLSMKMTEPRMKGKQILGLFCDICIYTECTEGKFTLTLFEVVEIGLVGCTIYRFSSG